MCLKRESIQRHAEESRTQRKESKLGTGSDREARHGKIMCVIKTWVTERRGALELEQTRSLG